MGRFDAVCLSTAGESPNPEHESGANSWSPFGARRSFKATYGSFELLVLGRRTRTKFLLVGFRSSMPRHPKYSMALVTPAFSPGWVMGFMSNHCGPMVGLP